MFSKKKEFIFVSLLLLFSLSIRVINLDFKEGGLIFDEANGVDGKGYYHIVQTYLKGEDDPNFMHPPLGKEILALGMKIFGDNAYGWRMPSVIFSTLGILVIYFLVREITKSKRAALLASFFLSLDFIYFIHSRLLTMEMIYLFFFWLSVFFFWKFLKSSGLISLWFGAFSFAAAFATKWLAVFVLIPFVIILLFKKDFKKLFLVFLSVSFSTALLYTASYLPFILRNSFGDFIALQLKILNFWIDSSSKGLNMGFIDYLTSHIFIWPLNPPWAYETATQDDGKMRIIWAMYHPALFYFMEFFLLKDLITSFKTTLRTYGKSLLLAASFLLPWVVITRNQYLYYALPAIPFLYAYLSMRVIRTYENDKWWFLAFSFTVIAVSIYFYPLITNVWVDEKYINFLSQGG